VKQGKRDQHIFDIQQLLLFVASLIILVFFQGACNELEFTIDYDINDCISNIQIMC